LGSLHRYNNVIHSPCKMLRQRGYVNRWFQCLAIAIVVLCGAVRSEGSEQAPDVASRSVVQSASISGAVVDGRGAPVRSARVTLSARELRGPRSISTDQRGRFSFGLLPAGRYTITARKDGFLTAAYGARAPGRSGTPLVVVPGQKLERIDLVLPRGGVLTGSIFDPDGEPVVGVEVRALRVVLTSGERRWQLAGSDRTDDRGGYRIYQLQPGEYVVNADPRLTDSGDSNDDPDAIDDTPRAAAVIYAPVYYPGTVVASGALRVPLGVSEERGGVDVQLQFVPTAKVDGAVTVPREDGGCVSRVALVATSSEIPAVTTDVSVTQADGDRFSFAAVAPGQYRVMARCVLRPRTAGGPGRVLWAERELMVSGQDTADADLTLRPGVTVSGRLQFEGGGTPDGVDLSVARVMLVSRGDEFDEIGREPFTARVETGRFEISGVPPGRYDVEASVLLSASARTIGPPVPRWTLDSALVNGQETLDFFLDVRPGEDIVGADLTLTNRRQELSGTLVDTSGAPAVEYTVIVFPTDRRFWLPDGRRIIATRPGTDGMFTINSLPAGEYYVAAAAEVEPGEWYDPEFLKRLVGVSVSVSVKPGAKTVRNLRVAR
jgi:hypothetical protein